MNFTLDKHKLIWYRCVLYAEGECSRCPVAFVFPRWSARRGNARRSSQTRQNTSWLEPWMLTYVWDLEHIKKHFRRKKTYTGPCFLTSEAQGLLCCSILIFFWRGCRDLCNYLNIYVLTYLPTYLPVYIIHLSSP